MNQEKRSLLLEIADESLICEVRQIIAEHTKQSPESITDEQLNEYLEQLLNEDENNVSTFCIHTLFEQQVEQRPNQIALFFENQSLTYTELNNRANQLAHYLRQRGVGAEVLVGICMSRTVDLIVGLLGVLKAGGAFLPLDFKEHQQRKQAILTDAQPTFLLTQEHLLSDFGKYGGEIIVLNRDWVNISLQETDNPTLLTSPENLAYVIYSLNRGILVEHRGVVNRLQWLQTKFNLSSSDAVVHKASLVLDTSYWEIFWPLIYGGRLVLASTDNQNNLTYLQRLIEEQQVSIIHFLPSELTAFLESCNSNSTTHLNSLRCVLSSGEPLQRLLVEKFFQHFRCGLYNLYGLPEAAGEVTVYECQSGDTRDVLPIGHPTHISVYVLDKYLQLVPEGVAGEIYIAGKGLSRGYLNDAEETASRFIKNPFSEKNADFLFKTGDRGRWLSDEKLELLNSIERQVYIKGFRIVLSDVEAAILSHPSVEDCAVLTRKTKTFGQELIAYVVSSGAFDPEKLAFNLQRLLPTAWMPNAYVPVFTLPLTTTGEVDEQILNNLEVIDSDLVQQWEEQLRSLRSIKQVAAIIQEHTESTTSLDLKDLLPN